ncbi:MAG: DUF2922 domain-containing protein [Eubacteriales bacterium]
MPTVELVLGFKRVDGGSSRLTIDNARSDVTEAEVNALMDQIITANLFEPSGSPLLQKISIDLITSETVELEVL